MRNAAGLAFASMFGEKCAKALEEELEEDSNNDQRRDDLLQPEDAADECDSAKGEERAGWNVVFWVESSKPRWEVAVSRGCVWDSGVSEQKCEDRGECGERDEDDDDAGGGVAVEALHEDGHGEHAGVELSVVWVISRQGRTPSTLMFISR